MERAPATSREVGVVGEDAALSFDAGFADAVFVAFDPVFFLDGAAGVALPEIGRELCDVSGDAFGVGFFAEVGAEAAAADVGGVFVDTWAAAAENAGPGGCEPGGVGSDDGVGLFFDRVPLVRVGKLHPDARGVHILFAHPTTLLGVALGDTPSTRGIALREGSVSG